MKVVLLGIRDLDFEPQDGGKRIQGTQLFVSFESVNVIGQETSKIFLKPDAVPKNIVDYIGVELDVDFNNKGKVQQIDFPAPAMKK